MSAVISLPSLTEGAVVFGTLVSLSTLKHVLSRLVSRGKPRMVKDVGVLSSIVIYPVKSCRGLHMSQAGVTQCGLVDLVTGVCDRHFMLVDEKDNFVSQRKEPSLALVTPSLHGNMLRLDAPGQTTLVLPMNPPITSDTHISNCRVWGDTVAGADCGSEAAGWFSRYLGRPIRLVYAGPGLMRRELHRDYSKCRPYDKVAFQDWGQTLLISDASLVNLNTRLETPVTMSHFRPNITVTGTEPFGEDMWHKLYMGGVQFTNIKLCGRCKMTTVDPESGIMGADQQPLKTLKEFRIRPPHTDPCFGINIFCDVEGTIHAGDRVQVTFKEG